MRSFAMFALSMTMAIGAKATVMPVCDRTKAVKEFIEATVGKNCASISDTDLAGIKRVAVNNKGISEFKADDFTGLTGLEILNIRSNPYTELPEGLFKDLGKLKTLVIIGTSLTQYPGDYLQFNPEIEQLYTFRNKVTKISDAVLTRIEGATRLKEMEFDSTLEQSVRDRLQAKFPDGGPVSLFFH